MIVYESYFAVLFGDGVVAALRPRITSEYPPYSHQGALQRAVGLDRFVGIVGTGGIILTLWLRMRGDSSLVKSNQFQQ